MGIVEPQLQALRTAVDVRLASLEAALADPSRGDSLERLILDLSRLATDEAQAAAARACGEVRLQAETEIFHIRKTAQAEFEQERAAGADLRQSLDRAQEQIAAAGREREKEVRALGERFEAQLSAARTALRDLEGVAAAVQSRLDAERTAAADLHAQLEAEQASAANLRRLLEEAQAAAARACGEVRLQADAEIFHTRKTAQAELEQERAAGADLRQSLDRAQEQIAAAGRERENEVRALGERFEAQLSAARTALRDLEGVAAAVQSRLDAERTAAADLHAQLEAERASAANLRRLVEEAKLRLSRAASDMAARAASDRQIQQELALARAEVDALRADRENARAQAAQARQEAHASPATSDDSPTDEGWKPVPLATRYTFPESTTIQIDGGLGLLCDLSSTGCQLLSPVVLKPNQGVKLLLPSAEPPIACIGTVVWARLEPPKIGQPLNYRAGVQFTKADETAIEAYAASHGVML